jgi:hypothetical protein
MPHDRAAPLQLVWSDDVGYVAAKVLEDLEDPDEDRRADAHLKWHGRAFDLVGDEASPGEIAAIFSSVRGRRGRRIRYRRTLPPSDACCPGSRLGAWGGCLCLLRLHERMSWA